jgi:serine protease inhibitor
LQVQLPKFRIESTHGELVEQLKALGITDLFDRGQADLSGISDQQNSLWVAKVIQKAFIVVRIILPE